MKFTSLRIQNFLAISNAELNLADRGLTLVVGENRDDTSAISNGAGKSSVADSICFALFGTTARGETGDAVINDAAGKDCSVAIGIEDGFDRYVITRCRKHSIGKNGLLLQWGSGTPGSPLKWVNLTQGTEKLTQAKIEKIIGCNYEVFRAAIYAGQNQMPDLPGMTDRQLKLVVEEAAGISVLEAAYEKARDALLTAKNDASNKENIRYNTEVLLKSEQNRLVDFQMFRTDWNDKQHKIGLELKDRHDGIREEHLHESKVLALLNKSKVIDDLADCDIKLRAVAGERATETRLQQDLSDLEKLFTSRITALEISKSTIADLKQDYGDIAHKIGCPCNACGRPITAAEIKPAQDAARATIKNRVDDYNARLTEARDIQAKLKDAQQALDAHRASMTDVSATNAERTRLRTLLDTIWDHEKKIGVYRDEMTRLEAEYKKAQAEVNPYDKQVVDIKAQIDALETKEKAERELVEEAHHARKIAEAAVKVFGPAGVRGQILDEVTPYLNDQTAKYLGVLSDGNITANWSTVSKTAKGELREKFVIEVSNGKGGKSFGLLSGGEKRKVQVAAALALQDLVATRATKPIDLMICDEIDSALDPAGLERLMDVFKEKAKERGSVFVISHNSLQDWIPDVITVVKENGISTISA